MLESIDGADRAFAFEGGKRIHPLPEMDGIAEFASGDAAEPLMFLAEDKSATLLQHGFAIAFEHGGADVLAFNGETPGLDGEMSADCETY
jgi:hypothetical protein